MCQCRWRFVGSSRRLGCSLADAHQLVPNVVLLQYVFEEVEGEEEGEGNKDGPAPEAVAKTAGGGSSSDPPPSLKRPRGASVKALEAEAAKPAKPAAKPAKKAAKGKKRK